MTKYFLMNTHIRVTKPDLEKHEAHQGDRVPEAKKRGKRQKTHTSFTLDARHLYIVFRNSDRLYHHVPKI